MQYILSLFDITGSVSRNRLRTIVRNGTNWRQDSINMKRDFQSALKKVKNDK